MCARRRDLELRLERGQMLRIGEKIYGRCITCDKVVRVNKRIFGSLHFCK